MISFRAIVHNIYKLPSLTINSVSEPILFADDTVVSFKQKFQRFLFIVKFR
jgi:hypothetical protein